MARDVLIEEAVRARLRPFALAAARKAAKERGPAWVSDERIMADAVEIAARAALNGLLPDAGTMTRAEFGRGLAGLAGGDGLGDLGGWFKKLRKAVKKAGDKIDDAAQSVGKSVDKLNRKIIKEVVMPVTAPTISYNLDKRENYKTYAAQAWKKYEASGRTDQQALADYQRFNLMARKRLDKVQDTVKLATAVVGAVVLAPTVAAALKPGGALSAAGAAGAGAVKSEARQAAIDRIAEEVMPDAVEALEDYQEVKGELEALDEEEAAEAVPDAPKSGGGILLPVAAVITALAFT